MSTDSTVPVDISAEETQNNSSKPSIATCTDAELFAILLAELHVKYDHGGYSMGRSLQADAIEFRHLIPFHGHATKYDGSLMEEMGLRIVVATRGTESNRKPYDQLLRQTVFDLGPAALDTNTLIQYTLGNLYWWYIRHAKNHGFMDEESPRIIRLLLDFHTMMHGDLIGDMPIRSNLLRSLCREIHDRICYKDNPDNTLYPWYADQASRLHSD